MTIIVTDLFRRRKLNSYYTTTTTTTYITTYLYIVDGQKSQYLSIVLNVMKVVFYLKFSMNRQNICRYHFINKVNVIEFKNDSEPGWYCVFTRRFK